MGSFAAVSVGPPGILSSETDVHAPGLCEGDRYLEKLNPHELQSFFGRGRHVQTRFNGLPDTLDHFVEGLGLSVAAGKLWDGSDVVAFIVPVDHDIELAGREESPT